MSQAIEIDASPEGNMRFMDALAEHAAAEHAAHDQRKIEYSLHRGILPAGDSDAPVTLEGINYGFSYHNLMDRDTIAELATGPCLELHPDVQAVFLGNLAVEQGHAEYDRITSEVFEMHPVFRAWKNTWVADEAKHPAAMQEWAKVTGAIDIREAFMLAQGYLRHGLSLHFPDAAHGLAFPAFQESATVLTHREVRSNIPADEGILAARIGRQILGDIIWDEGTHKVFYTRMVRHALETGDPEIVSRMMIAVAHSALGFIMPGMEGDIPTYEQITDAYIRTGVFTIQQIATKVILKAVGDADAFGWKIGDRTDLNDDAKRAQAMLLAFVDKLQSVLELDDPEDVNKGILVAVGRARVKANRTFGGMQLTNN